MTRRHELLSEAATALDDGRDPLELAFLVEHEVTLDECYDLAIDLALGARMVLATTRDLASWFRSRPPRLSEVRVD